jgi:hypothetical protein
MGWVPRGAGAWKPDCRGFQEGIVLVILEQTFDGGPQGRVIGANAFQIGGPCLGVGLSERFEKNLALP